MKLGDQTINHRVFFVIILIIFNFVVLDSCADPVVESVVKKQELKKGKLDGTFSFIYKVRFSDFSKPDFPVDILIREGITLNGNVVYSKRAEKGEDTIVSVDLPPGKYNITSRPIEEIHKKEFWEGGGIHFEIDDNGLLKHSLSEIHFTRKLKVECPKGTFIIPDEKKSLLLKWIPEKDIVYYDVIWIIESEKTGKDVKELEKRRIKEHFFKFNFNINEDYLKESRYRIVWMLFAKNELGVTFGYASDQFKVNIKK